MTRIVRLTSALAEQVERLAGCHWPYRMSRQELSENLEGLDEEGCNLSFGIEQDGTLRGYLLAWVDNSRAEGRAEDVVLVADVVLDTSVRGYLYRLLRQALSAMRNLGHRGLPVEGDLRPGARDTFVRHPEVMEALGYHLAETRDYQDPVLGESITWVRFEPNEGRRVSQEDEEPVWLDHEEPPEANPCR